MDERQTGKGRNAALAANMRRLRAGRSIQTLRSEMAKQGLSIGQGTLQRAINGEVGNRLESLDKIAQFFDTTVDQLLQFDGVDDTYWPFSAELQRRVLLLNDEELLRAENVLRAHCGLPSLQVVTADLTLTPEDERLFREATPADRNVVKKRRAA